MPKALADLLQLESLNQATPPTFPELLEKLYRARYTGLVTFHFAGGQPLNVEFPQSVSVALDHSGKRGT